MAGETIERARGRWRELLPRLGVSPKHLSNKHGPCPVCGGRDRFRFDDREGSGSYYCNQCGPGSGIVLVQRVNGWTFREAADAIDQLIGEIGIARVDRRSERDDGRNVEEKRRRDVEAVLREATDRRIVRDYLVSRGLRTVPAAMRGHPGLPLYDGDGRWLGRFPAVVTPVQGPDGEVVNAHRIFLTDRSRQKKLMPRIKQAKGAALRLFDVGETVGIAEGPETAIACYERDRIPTWAGVSSKILEGFQPPPGVRWVVVYGDNDQNFEGQRASYNLARRLVREGYAVDVCIPPQPDTDWLDVHATPEACHG